MHVFLKGKGVEKKVCASSIVSDISRASLTIMGFVARKPVFGVSDKASIKPVSSSTGTIARKLKFHM